MSQELWDKQAPSRVSKPQPKKEKKPAAKKAPAKKK